MFKKFNSLFCLVMILLLFSNLYSFSKEDYMRMSRSELLKVSKRGIIPKQVTDEDVSFTPLDLDSLGGGNSFAWQVLSNGENLTVNVGPAPSYTATVAVPDNWYGEDVVIFLSTDSLNQSATHAVIYKVNPVNDQPSFDINSSYLEVEVNEDEGFVEIPNFLENISAGDSFEDTLGESVSFVINDIEEPTYFDQLPTITRSGTSGTLSFKVKDDFFFTDDSIFVKIVDEGGLDSTKAFKLVVNPVNDAPDVTIIPVVVGEPDTQKNISDFAIDFDKGDKNTANLESGQTLNITLEGIDNSLYTTIPTVDVSSGELQFKAKDLTDLATDDITLKLEDSEGGFVEKNFKIIIAANPVLSNLPDRTENETDSEITFENTNLSNYLTGGHDNTFTYYQKSGSSLSVTLNGSIATVVAPANWSGVEYVKFEVTTGAPDFKKSSDVVLYTVLPTNDAP
ncbi:MAG: hypothetical protein CSA15_08565, partial [Candidatus Delongbacteria bacterium]